VQVTDLTNHYEGAHRPGHFTGVATVVLKLFNIVRPDISVFGKKDYQQYRVISKMVADLNLDVQIIGQETTREDSGLATSSRNQYLDPDQTDKAALIYQILGDSARQISEGERDFKAVEARAVSRLDEAGFKTDYFTVCNAETLLPASAEDRDLVILVTAELGATRLLDNIEISLW
jgi:pantoate--beta-alanine ligase